MASTPRLLSSYISAAQTEPIVWFDVSMFCICVTNYQPTGDSRKLVPESLIMHFPLRDISVSMEINGSPVPPSKEVFLILRHGTHMQKNNSTSADAPADFMYVSTDNLRTSSTLQFQILEQVDSATLVVSGSLEKKMIDTPTSPVAKLRKSEWIMASSCEIGPEGCGFVKAKHELSKHGMGVSISPSVASTVMEICVVGKVMGEPMILTQTVPLIVKHQYNFTTCGTQNAIPEDNDVDKPTNDVGTLTMASLDFFEEANETSFCDIPRSRCGANFTSKSSVRAANFKGRVQMIKFDSSSLNKTETDQEETWYKRGISTGINVGLGIGIGMCIGVGIGVGLIIHKLCTTTNSLKRITL